MPDNAVLKSIDKLTGANGQVISLAGTSVKLLAVHFSHEIDVGNITFLYGTIRHLLGILLLYRGNIAVYIFICHFLFIGHPIYFYPFVPADRHILIGRLVAAGASCQCRGACQYASQ